MNQPENHTEPPPSFKHRVRTFLNEKIIRPAKNHLTPARTGQEAEENGPTPLSWEDAKMITLAGAGLMAIAGLLVGAAAGWVVLPALAGWAGAQLATAATAGTALATGSLLGLNAAGWLGAVAGLAAGAVAALAPLSRKITRTSEYRVQSIITPDIDYKIDQTPEGKLIIDPEDLPHTKEKVSETIKTYRLGDGISDTAGITTALAAAFAGAALGMTTAGLIKAAEARQFIYAGRRPTPPS